MEGSVFSVPASSRESLSRTVRQQAMAAIESFNATTTSNKRKVSKGGAMNIYIMINYLMCCKEEMFIWGNS